MRLVHTADWHLGQSFGPFSRDLEHAAFLTWLLDVLEEERADALLICGDIFETGNPLPAAQRRYYDFLATATTDSGGCRAGSVSFWWVSCWD